MIVSSRRTSPKLPADPLLPRHQIEVVGLDVVGPALLDRLLLLGQQLELQRARRSPWRSRPGWRRCRRGRGRSARPRLVAGGAVDQLGGDAHPAAGLAHAAFQDVADAQLAGDLRARRRVLPLKVNAVLRATTDSAETLDRSVMMSSVMPSLKYSCSGSPLMLAKGSTQTEDASASRAACPRPRRWSAPLPRRGDRRFEQLAEPPSACRFRPTSRGRSSGIDGSRAAAFTESRMTGTSRPNPALGGFVLDPGGIDRTRRPDHHDRFRFFQRAVDLGREARTAMEMPVPPHVVARFRDAARQLFAASTSSRA